MKLDGISVIQRPEAFQFIQSALPPLIQYFKRGSKLYRWLFVNLFHPLMREHGLNKFIQKRHYLLPYRLIFGMDPEGLATAAYFAKVLDVPYAYWSLELLLASEIRTAEKKKIKQLEVTNNIQGCLTIVQDRWRGSVLIKENGLDPNRVFYVPNAPRGIARRIKSNYLHKRYNIAQERKIILCSGSISAWSMSEEIILASRDWSEEFVLVMQSRALRSIWKDDYVEKVTKQVDPKKVIISFDPVPQNEFSTFVDSADIGIALYLSDPANVYNNLGENIRTLGLSSGKIAGYLFSGLPVIVNDSVIGPKELVESSDCGICIGQPGEIANAMRHIIDRYEWYSEKACQCFNEILQLDKNFQPVMKEVERLWDKNNRKS